MSSSKESTKRYANSSGGQKSQTTPTDACKDDGAQFIVGNISPRRPRPESSEDSSSIFGRFEIDDGNHLHLSETELLFRANDL